MFLNEPFLKVKYSNLLNWRKLTQPRDIEAINLANCPLKDIFIIIYFIEPFLASYDYHVYYIRFAMLYPSSPTMHSLISQSAFKSPKVLQVTWVSPTTNYFIFIITFYLVLICPEMFNIKFFYYPKISCQTWKISGTLGPCIMQIHLVQNSNSARFEKKSKVFT